LSYASATGEKTLQDFR